MDRIKALGREPALLLDLGETLIVFLIAFGIGGLTGDDQSYLVAALIGLVGVMKAFTTKPFPVTVLTDATRALLVCAAAVFGVGLTSDQIVIAATLVGTLFTLISRAQITPRNDSVQAPAGAGAGPVTGARNEGGYGALATVGLVILIVGLILLVLGLLGVVAIGVVWPLVLVVIGVVMWLGGSRV